MKMERELPPSPNLSLEFVGDLSADGFAACVFLFIYFSAFSISAYAMM